MTAAPPSVKNIKTSIIKYFPSFFSSSHWRLCLFVLWKFILPANRLQIDKSDSLTFTFPSSKSSIAHASSSLLKNGLTYATLSVGLAFTTLQDDLVTES